MYKFGPVQQKILLLLLGGIGLGMETSSLRYYRKLRIISKEWKRIDQRSLRRSVKRLCSQKLVQEKYSPDGSFKLVLTKEGVRQARAQCLYGSAIRFRNPKKWDGKWRVIVFDIPEKSRLFRNILREHLRALKFYRLQQSVFVSPYPCEKQIMELVTLYQAEAFVRVMKADWVDSEGKLKKHFFKKSPK